MTTFDKREKEFEARFKHDEDFRFKVTARRNRLLGLWAAERMGLSGAAAAAYAKTIVAAEFEHGGDSHVVDKVAADLTAKGCTTTTDQIAFELAHFAAHARQELMVE
ncbi:MAG TPA: DUF1476 domain-containing protein [Stellaceae bacterium]|jgi:hypothetical protein